MPQLDGSGNVVSSAAGNEVFYIGTYDGVSAGLDSTIATQDYEITCVQKFSGVGSSDQIQLGAKRTNNDNGDRWVVYYSQSSGKWLLYEYIGGSANKRAQYVTGITTGADYTVVLRFTGSTVEVDINGTTRLSYDTGTTGGFNTGGHNVYFLLQSQNVSISHIKWQYLTYTFLSVDKTTTEIWDIYNSVTKTATELWNIRQTFEKAATERWNIRNTVEKTATELWNIIWLNAQKTTTERWNIYETLEKVTTELWRIFVTGEKTETDIWHIRFLNTEKTFIEKWQIQALNVFFSIAPLDSGQLVYYAVVDRYGNIIQDFTNTDVVEFNPKTALTIPAGRTPAADFSAYGVVIQMSAGFQGRVIFLGKYAGYDDFFYEQINGYINALPAIKEQTDKLQFSGNGFVFSAPQINVTVGNVEDIIAAIETIEIEPDGAVQLLSALRRIYSEAAGEQYIEGAETVVKTPQGSERMRGTIGEDGTRTGVTYTDP